MLVQKGKYGGLTGMNRAVFLDRDGVINRAVVIDGKPFPPLSQNQFEILPGVPEAVATLKQAGFHVIVVTNQPDVATGKQQRSVVETWHRRLRNVLAVDDIYVCYHTDAHNCPCRKPKPGMLLDAAERWRLQLSNSFLVGDRWRDIEAGQRAGCLTLLVQGVGYRERAAQNPTWVVGSLLEASQMICSMTREGGI